MGWTRRLLEGDPTALSKFSERMSCPFYNQICVQKADQYILEWFVDVEDAARLCVIGLLDSAVNSERIFAFAEQMNWTDVVGVFRKLQPNNNRIPDPPANELRDSIDVLPRKRADELLRAFGQEGFTPTKESLARGIEGLK